MNKKEKIMQLCGRANRDKTYLRLDLFLELDKQEIGLKNVKDGGSRLSIKGKIAKELELEFMKFIKEKLKERKIRVYNVKHSYVSCVGAIPTPSKETVELLRKLNIKWTNITKLRY